MPDPGGTAGILFFKTFFMQSTYSIKLAMITGSLLSVMASISWSDVERTLVLGSLGAFVSFIVSYFMKQLLDKKQH